MNMSEWIISASVLILIVLLLRVLLRERISMRLRYGLWALVLLRLLLPFSLGSSQMSVMTPIAQQAAVSGVMQPPAVVTPVPVPTADLRPQEGSPQYGGSTVQNSGSAVQGTGTVPQLPQRVRDPAPLLRGLWFCGMGLTALCFAICNLLFARKLRRSRQVLETGEHRLTVYVSDAVDSPCLYGVFRPCVYVTEEVARDQELLRNCLCHEMTHYLHGDHIWALLRCLCLVLHWYNPLVWCAAFISRNDGELACDEAAVKRMDGAGRASYGRTLLQLSCSRPLNPLDISTSMSGNGKLIRERISRLVKKPNMAAYTLAAVLLIAAAAVGCTFTGAKEALNPEATPSVTPTPIPTAAGTGSGFQIPEDSLLLYACDGLYVPIPADCAEDLIVYCGEEAGEDALISVYLKAAVEAYRASGQQEDPGVGFLFSITRMDRVALERLLCADHSGCRVFAQDENWYYCLVIPTDVRFYPTGDEADLERWEELSSRLPAQVQEEFLLRNALERFDEAALYSGYTYEGEHLTAYYYPYASVNGSKEEVYTLVLSQPVQQGEGGIWCVERMIGAYGEVYLWFPDTGVPAAEHYARLQEACDRGLHPELLEPAGAARAFLAECGYFSSPVTEESLEYEAPFGPADAIYALFDETGSMELNLYLANEGALRPYGVQSRWYAERIAVLISIFDWKEIEMPPPMPAEFWLTAESVGGEQKLTFWPGEAGTVQYHDGERTVFWQASWRVADQSWSIADELRVEYNRLDASYNRISFYLEGTAEEAAETFVRSVYGSHLMNLAPGNGSGISDYDVVHWELLEVSEDGQAVLGRFTYAFVPDDPDSADIWAGNTNYGSGEFEGMLTASREFVLQRRADGYWYCIDLGTGGARLPD